MSKNNEKFSVFAETIAKQKYLQPGETWASLSQRVTQAVFGAIPERCQHAVLETQAAQHTQAMIADRQFIPGGRYLYSAGREWHQTQNCFDGNTEIVTDTGIFALNTLVGKAVRVRNKYGIWEDATIQCFGEQELFDMRFSNGTSVLVTGNHRWWQSDGSRVTTLEAETVPLTPAAAISADPEGIRHGIIYGDGHVVVNRYSQVVLCGDKKQELSNFFEKETRQITVGFGATIHVDTVRETKRGRIVSLQPIHYKALPQLACTPEYARGFITGLIATDGCVAAAGSVTISMEGYEKAVYVAKLAVLAGCVVNSVCVASRINPFNGSARELSVISLKPYSITAIRADQVAQLEKRRLRKNFLHEQDVVSVTTTGRFEPVYCAVVPGSESFTLANGLTTSNCLMLRAEDTSEGWAALMQKATAALMSGAGIGVDYSALREEGAPIKRKGGVSTGPLACMRMVNELGRNIMQGGSRRSAIWAGLNWQHPDVLKFIKIKNWSDDVRALKAKDFNFAADLDMTNISVILDRSFFVAYYSGDTHARSVYDLVTRQMVTTAEPGFSVDYDNPRESLRNACCELTSEDDSDICNIGSLNMARFDTLESFKIAVQDATVFLLAGTLYSDVPYEKVAQVRTKNRRLGLGLMGVHEWLLKRGKKYGPDEELKSWLSAYRDVSTDAADTFAARWAISRPLKTRAIAPTGSISIIAETTSGIEPLFCVAYKRRYLKGGAWVYQNVIDPVAKRLIVGGIEPKDIEDAYVLARCPETRLAFQAWMQQFVDHGISSTVNLPAWETEFNNESSLDTFRANLLGLLPLLRGITVYPDGCRSGQPLTPIAYEDAINNEGVETVEEYVDSCDITKGGSCGS